MQPGQLLVAVWPGHVVHGKAVYSVALLFFFCLFRVHPEHVEVSRLGVELELQLPTYTTATATGDLSCIATYATAHSNV